VTLQSSAGCDSIVTTDLTVVNALSTSVTEQICSGQTFTLPDGSIVSASGLYPVTLQSSAGCDSIVTTDLTVVTVLSTSVTEQICSGQTFTLPDGSVVSASGLYPVTLQSSAGCDSIVTTDLTVVNALSTSVTEQICSGQTFTLPDGSVVSASGLYPVTLQSSAGCDSIVVTDLKVNIPTTTNVNALICTGQTYTLPDGNVVSNGGTYPVTLTASNGCDSIVSTVITVEALPSIFLGNDTLICDGATLLLDIGNQTGEWQDGSTGSSYNVSLPGIYFVTVASNCGAITDTIIVTSESCIKCDVYLPNAFTPNKDGINDVFTPIITCDAVIPFVFRIYNRWNELVFETDQPGTGWDGVFKNQLQPNEAYIYYLSYFNTQLNKMVEIKGVVTMIY
jgi:gliding motility-associated-like protein